MRFFLFFLLLVSIHVQAQDLKTADQYLKNGEYSKALEIYKDIEKTGHANAEMYRNMALIMDKDNKLGWTILYLEKAILLSPYDSKTIQFIENIKSNVGLPKDIGNSSVGKKLIKNIFNIPKGVWWTMSLLLMLYLSFYIWKRTPKFEFRPKDLYTIALSSFFVLSLGALGFVNHYFYENTYIVIQDTSMKLSPDGDSPSAIELTEGSKVKVLEILDSWIKVKDFYGDEGWISITEAVKI